MLAWLFVLVVVLLLFGPILLNLLGTGHPQEENEDPAWVASERSRHEALDDFNRRRKQSRRAA